MLVVPWGTDTVYQERERLPIGERQALAWQNILRSVWGFS